MAQSPQVVAATIRLTVQGPGARADLVVPLWMAVGSLAEEYSRRLGTGEPSGVPTLATSSGTTLEPRLTVQEAGLSHGDVLVAVPHEAAEAGRPGAQPTDDRVRPVPGAALLVVASVSAVAAAGVAVAAGGTTRNVCVLLLLVCAVLAALPLAAAAGARARSAVSPVLAGAAGFAASYSSGPGGVLLGAAVAALAALVLAAVARSFLDEDHDELVDVWLVAAVAVAVAATILLLVGAPVAALFAVLFAGAVVAGRLLPFLVVDVPDQALLDLDRLAVTAWSAREQPRGSRRRRSTVRTEGVSAIAHRGQRLVSAGTVAVAVLVAVTGPLLVVSGAAEVTHIGRLAMVGLGAAALALVSRSFRSVLPRLVLRLSAAWVAGFLAVDLVRASAGEPSRTGSWIAFGAAAAVAVLVTVAAVAVGHGWRSIWWARVADLIEALSIVLVVAGVVVASGLFERVLLFAG